jgi:hypothetical protein
LGIENFLLKLPAAKCPSCNFQLRLEHIKAMRSKSEYQCPQCQHPIPTRADGPPLPIQIDKANAVATPQVKVTHRGDEFRVDIRWLSKSSFLTISFAVMWNAIIWLMGSTLLTAEAGEVRNATLGYAAVGSFGLLGLWLVYLALCEVFNTTTILVKSDKIAFWTKPIAMSGPQVIDVSAINNLSLERVVEGHKNNRRSFKHFINIQLKNGDLVQLCKVQNMNEGLYVEKILEEKLGLKDNPKLDQIVF